MRTRTTVVLFLVFGLASIYAQSNSTLETYQANFASADIQTKLEILRSADSQDPSVFGPLYGQALSYVVSNAEDLLAQPMLREIGLMSVNRINQGGYQGATDNLWRLFDLYEESSARIQILSVLAAVGNDDEIRDLITRWVAEQNTLFRSGQRADLQVTTSAVIALRSFGGSASFSTVLDTILFQFPDFVTAEAQKTLDAVEGSRFELSVAAIRARDVLDKRPAFDYFVESGYLNEADLGAFGAEALADALRASPRGSNERELLRQLRYAAATVVRENLYSEATAVMIRHFNQTVLEFERGIAPKNRVLEAIAGLGAMGNAEAAARLTDYLELLNTYTEVDRPYDSQVVLATIANLRFLGAPESYNALFYTTLLDNYPDTVKDAAREAMEAVSR